MKPSPDPSRCPPPPTEPPPVDNLVGLALSGGGIRSASFNLGVLQGLHSRGLLWMFDYLSTVSGGGFIGSWWSAWLSRSKRSAGDVFPREEELEPQRRSDTAVLHDSAGGTSPVPSLPDGTLIAQRDDPIHFVRLFSNYLTPKTGAFSPDTWRMIAFYVRSLLLTWIVILPLFLAAVIAAQAFYLTDGVAPLFLCDVDDCPATIGQRLAHFWLPFKLLLTAAATLSLLWLAHSSARLGLALLGLVAVGALAVIVAARLPMLGSATGLDMKVVAVAAICVLWHAAHSLRDFERNVDGVVVRASSADHRSWLTQKLSILLKYGTVVALLLLVAGFSHDFVHLLEMTTRQALARAGGLAGLIATIVSTAYVVYIKSPTTTGVARSSPGRLGRILLAMAPPLVLIVLALSLAYFGHFLLVWSASSAVLDRVPAALATAVIGLAALQVVFALFESCNDPTTPPYEGRFDWRRFVPGFALQAIGQAQSPGDKQAWYYFFSPRGWVRLVVLGALLVIAASGADRARSEMLDALFGNLEASAASAILIVALAITFAKREWPIALGSARPSSLLSLACLGATLALLVRLGHADSLLVALLWIAVLIGIVIALGWLADPNLLSMHAFYKGRLARAYLGASNTARRNEDITDAAPGDDIALTELWNHDPGGPYHLINTTLNLVGSADLAMSQRYAENFVMSRYHCGSARAGFRCTAQYMDGTLSLATAAAASGAAASPTMGSQTPSAALALLMALFNIRLGFWAPNPSGRRWNDAHARLWPFYLLRETLSSTGSLGPYCYLTDGGHFDNTGLYALVERGCRYIVVCDCGADPQLGFNDIGVAIRRCRIDFGAEIDLRIDDYLALDAAGGTARTHVVSGTIRYQADHLRMLRLPPSQDQGIIVWIKPAVTPASAADVRQYRRGHADFPQQPTCNQWYDESQFESYRRLGYESARAAFDDAALAALGTAGSFANIDRCFETTRSTYRAAQAQLATAAVELHAQTTGAGAIGSGGAMGGSASGVAAATNSRPLPGPLPILYVMDGDDRALQLSRLWLGQQFERVMERGLNEYSAALVHQLAITQHNGAWAFEISRNRIQQHREEADALFAHLTAKLLAGATNRYSADLASALGIIVNNMRGRILTLRTH